MKHPPEKKTERQHAPKCGICGQEKPPGGLVPADSIRPELAAMMAEDKPDWAAAGFVCRADLAKYRHRYVSEIMLKERSELSALDRAVIASIAKQETLAKDTDTAFDANITAGDLWADRVASFGGSWTFIGLFAAVVALWITGNAVALSVQPFDPYPFILLNLILSMLAALQAPIIMMSQNRQAARDRLEAAHDYEVNLKAELEIQSLHEKLDALRERDWSALVAQQQEQIQLLQRLLGRATGDPA